MSMDAIKARCSMWALQLYFRFMPVRWMPLHLVIDRRRAALKQLSAQRSAPEPEPELPMLLRRQAS